MTYSTTTKDQRVLETSFTIGEQSAGKVLRPFGSASVRKVVSEARAQAEREGSDA